MKLFFAKKKLFCAKKKPKNDQTKLRMGPTKLHFGSEKREEANPDLGPYQSRNALDPLRYTV